MADNLLDKASILLTPTAYNDGRMLSVKPNENLYGSELLLNPNFEDSSWWGLDASWSISNGSANCNGTGTIYKGGVVTIGKTYKVQVEISSYTSGTLTYPNASNYSIPSAIGVYTFYYVANSQTISFTGSSFIGSIDNVSVVEDLSGDFTFSRGSAATRVNAQGLVENVQIISSELVSNGNFSQEGSELVTNGDFVTDSDWSKGANWTISGGTANSDGVNATSNFSQVVTSFSGKTFLVEGSASNVSQGFAYISLGGTDLQIVVNSNGSFKHYVTISSGNSTLFISARNNFIGSIDNVSIKEVGQDWSLGSGWSIGDEAAIAENVPNLQRLQQNISGFTPVVGATYQYSFDISNVDGFYTIWAFGGNVLNSVNTEGAITGTFEATSTNNGFYFAGATVNGLISATISNISVKEITDDTDLPRIDYTDGCGSWLLEPQSTNLITQSELFSDSSWVKTNSSITSNLVISPDGALNADKLVEDASTGEKFTQTIRPVSNTTIYTASVFVKFAGREWIRFTDAQSSNRIHFNTKTGVFGAVTGTVISYNSIALDNGWYKLSLTTTSVATAYAVRIVLAENDNDVSYTGDGTSGVYVWGAQLEEQSYATSYIPTNGAIATRLADVATNSGNSTLINSTEGVLYAEIAALADDGTIDLYAIIDGTYNNIALRIGSMTTIIKFLIFSKLDI